MAQGSMDSNEGAFGRELPLEIIEQVLALLPVPDLYRLRSVCKAWNELICKPSFHNLRDVKGKKEAYLFLTWGIHHNYSGEPGNGHWKHRIDPLFRRRTTFLDVGAGRWYSIKADDESRDDGLEVVSVSMNDGLVCELTRVPGDGGEYHALFISDPVANIRRDLPALPTLYDLWLENVSPTIVIAVDNGAHSFRVFLVVYTKQFETKMHVYESWSTEWRGLASPPRGQGFREAASAVVFQGVLYVIFNGPTEPNTVCSLLSYDLQEDMWRVLEVDIDRCSDEDGVHVPDPDVRVSDNELWMTRWYDNSEDDEYFDTENDVFFEATRIVITESSSVKIVACSQISQDLIWDHLDESEGCAYPFPYTLCDDSVNACDPVIWMSEFSGKMIMSECESDWVDVLPAHPVEQSSVDKAWQTDMPRDMDMPVEVADSYTYYRAWYMNLSMRNILSLGPVTIDPHS